MTTHLPDASSGHTTDRRTLLRSTAALGIGAVAVRLAGDAPGAAAQATPDPAPMPTPPPVGPAVGAVYAMTNGDGVGNAVVGFARDDAGRLAYLGATPTGGQGTGRRHVSDLRITSGFDPLMSNHALIHDPDRRLLFAVNAADGTVVSLAVAPDYALAVVSTADAGSFPTSLAHHGGILVVALSGRPAAGEPSSLVSFTVADDGTLTSVVGSATVLSDAPMTKPTDVVFTADGRFVVVTDTMTSLLSVFPVGADGLLGPVVETASAGMGPFGSAVGAGGLLVSTETQGGAAMGFGKASLSTYTVGDDGALTVVANQVPNTRTAACWVSLTPDGGRAITANTADGTVSTYAVADDGTVALQAAVAAQQVTTVAQGAAPIDAAITPDGRFYYQLWGGLGAVTGYAIGGDGSLAPIDGGIGGGLPQLGAQGVVAV